MTTLPSSRVAAPGWYPDPYRRSAQRWFDGAQWTGHVHPAPAAAAAAAPTPYGQPSWQHRPTPWRSPVRSSQEGRLAPWVGLAAFLLGPSAGITAVLLAVLALCNPQHQTHPSRTRVGVAIALATVGTLLFTAFWASQDDPHCGCPSEQVSAVSVTP